MPDQKQKKKGAHENAFKKGKTKFRCAVCGHVSKDAGNCCGRAMDQR